LIPCVVEPWAWLARPPFGEYWIDPSLSFCLSFGEGKPGLFFVELGCSKPVLDYNSMQ